MVATAEVNRAATGPARHPLRIAVLAPPWIPVPPPGYGGIELVVGLLCDGLVRRGHDVTLYAAPGSSSVARVEHVLPAGHPDEIERALHEVDHVAQVFAALDRAADRGQPFEVLHDHSGFTAVAMGDRIGVPVVHTLHGPFDADTAGFYQRHAGKAHLVAISHAQRASAPPGLSIKGTVPNPMDARRWPFRTGKQDYVLWIGRMCEAKGPHRAIAAARAAGVPLVLAGPVQPGQAEFFDREVRPHLDGRVRYVGEVRGAVKQDLFADARALLMPIRWPEPFGMVMVEALACGTPVIAFPEGAAPEIVQHGRTGYLVDDEQAMADAVAQLDEIDPVACRAWIAQQFSVEIAAAGYEVIYRQVVAQHASIGPSRVRPDRSRELSGQRHLLSPSA
jgi:glycosyltransferase involved in cell wall biosynthesis